MEWAEKGVRKDEYVRPFLRRMERSGQYGVYFIFQSMEQGPTFRCTVPKFPTQDPNPRILAQQRSRFKRKRQSKGIYTQASFGAEVESWWHREDSIAGTGAGRKRIG
jgi:hypothetical protein